jgi:signal transduction histidine kinase/CheY-like chemotaxis protein
MKLFPQQSPSKNFDDAASGFANEVRGLRAEMLRDALLKPVLIFTWLIAFIVLTLRPEKPIWLTLASALALFCIALVCWLLVRGNEPLRTIASPAFAISAWLWAMSQLALGGQTSDAIWLIIACVAMTLLVGPKAGWLSAGLAVAWMSGAQVSGVLEMALPQMLLCGLGILCLTWVAHRVSNILFRTLAWMESAYAEARARAQSLSERNGDLAATLKNLQQTSFALARANEQLNLMVSFAEDARRSKQEFAANISHELRTPLNLIIGFSDIVLKAPTTYKARNLPPGLLADVQVIHRNAHHLLSLVNDILDLSQLDVNYMTIVREPTQVREFIENALDDFRELIHERNLTLTLDIPADLPEVYADRTRIRQVLLNLVANALRFTDAGEITVRVTTRLESRDDGRPTTNETSVVSASEPHRPSSVVISVQDTGIGIAPQDIQRIFEPFMQVDNSLGRKHSGTGLGLTISKQFVELHGGRMWVDSDLGHGSTFSFTLPLQMPTNTSPIETTHRARPRHEMTALGVIESGSALSRVLSHHIETLKVAHATSASALSQQFSAAPPEVVIINAPLTSYGNALSEANWPEAWRKTPMLHCFVPSPEAFLNHPQVRGYIVKPITQDQLEDAIATLLTTNSNPNSNSNAIARVLLVEDDEDALRLLSRMVRAVPTEKLGRFKAVVPIEARSGEQALELLHAADADTLCGMLLDMALGAISGHEVLRTLAQEARLSALPVCIVSGQELRSDPLASPHLLVLKPGGLSLRELTQAITALLPIVQPGLPTATQFAAPPQAALP